MLFSLNLYIISHCTRFFSLFCGFVNTAEGIPWEVYEKLDNKRNFTAASNFCVRIAIPHESAMDGKLTVGRDQFWPKYKRLQQQISETKATSERQRLALNAAKSNKLWQWGLWRPLVQFLIKLKRNRIKEKLWKVSYSKCGE